MWNAISSALALLGGFTTSSLEDAQTLIRAHQSDILTILNNNAFNADHPEAFFAVRAEKQSTMGTNYRITMHNSFTKDTPYCLLAHSEFMRTSHVVDDVLLGECPRDAPLTRTNPTARPSVA